MNKLGKSKFILICIAASTLLLSNFSIASTIDHSKLHVDSISKDTRLHVYLFSSKSAKMGNAKHHDTASLMAHTAPHLLLIDIVSSLRDSGFNNVILEESTVVDANIAAGELALIGRFTELDPGSQAVRQWIGFGAGKSRVCLKGHLVDAAQKSLGEFSDCRSSLGWGGSSGEMEDSTLSIGEHIASLLSEWAD